ncbi:MAG: AMP-binding protein, partial [Promethearchaeia archaeon]
MSKKSDRIKGKGRITVKVSGGNGYKSYWIYIPSKIAKHSSFPFSYNDEVEIEIIDGERLMVSKYDGLFELVNKYGIQNATIPRVLQQQADRNKDKPFLYFNDKVYSYKDMNENSNRIAHGILNLINEMNIKLVKKPKIALMLPNCPEFIFTWFGVNKVRCILVPVNRFLRGPTLQYILDHCDAKILIIEYEYLKYFEEIKDQLPKIKKVIIRNAPDDFKFGEMYMDFKDIYTDNIKNPEVTVKNSDMMEILYTSGTTGRPKGVVYRHFHVLAGLVVGKELEEIGFTENDILYCPLPLFHAFGQLLAILPVLFYNASIVIPDKFHASTFWEDVIKYKCTAICYIGGIISMLMNQPPSELDRKHSVKFAVGGEAPR